MHYFIFATKNSYITENSPGHIIQYPNSTDKNYGGDEIVELKKEFVNSYSTSPHGVSRMLIQFDYSDVSASIVNGDITSPKFYLRYYEVEGQQKLDKDYSLSSFIVAYNWEEGIGKHYDNPKTTDGVTWTDYNSGSVWTNTSVLQESGSRTTGGGVWWNPDVDSSTTGFQASQSFANQSGDIEMDVTDIVFYHLGAYGGFLATY